MGCCIPGQYGSVRGPMDFKVEPEEPKELYPIEKIKPKNPLRDINFMLFVFLAALVLYIVWSNI